MAQKKLQSGPRPQPVLQNRGRDPLPLSRPEVRPARFRSETHMMYDSADIVGGLRGRCQLSDKLPFTLGGLVGSVLPGSTIGHGARCHVGRGTHALCRRVGPSYICS